MSCHVNRVMCTSLSHLPMKTALRSLMFCCNAKAIEWLYLNWLNGLRFTFEIWSIYNFVVHASTAQVLYFNININSYLISSFASIVSTALRSSLRASVALHIFFNNSCFFLLAKRMAEHCENIFKIGNSTLILLRAIWAHSGGLPLNSIDAFYGDKHPNWIKRIWTLQKICGFTMLGSECKNNKMWQHSPKGSWHYCSKARY